MFHHEQELLHALLSSSPSSSSSSSSSLSPSAAAAVTATLPTVTTAGRTALEIDVTQWLSSSSSASVPPPPLPSSPAVSSQPAVTRESFAQCVIHTVHGLWQPLAQYYHPSTSATSTIADANSNNPLPLFAHVSHLFDVLPVPQSAPSTLVLASQPPQTPVQASPPLLASTPTTHKSIQPAQSVKRALFTSAPQPLAAPPLSARQQHLPLAMDVTSAVEFPSLRASLSQSQSSKTQPAQPAQPALKTRRINPTAITSSKPAPALPLPAPATVNMPTPSAPPALLPLSSAIPAPGFATEETALDDILMFRGRRLSGSSASNPSVPAKPQQQTRPSDQPAARLLLQSLPFDAVPLHASIVTLARLYAAVLSLGVGNAYLTSELSFLVKLLNIPVFAAAVASCSTFPEPSDGASIAHSLQRASTQFQSLAELHGTLFALSALDNLEFALPILGEALLSHLRSNPYVLQFKSGGLSAKLTNAALHAKAYCARRPETARLESSAPNPTHPFSNNDYKSSPLLQQHQEHFYASLTPSSGPASSSPAPPAVAAVAAVAAAATTTTAAAGSPAVPAAPAALNLFQLLNIPNLFNDQRRTGNEQLALYQNRQRVSDAFYRFHLQWQQNEAEPPALPLLQDTSFDEKVAEIMFALDSSNMVWFAGKLVFELYTRLANPSSYEKRESKAKTSALTAGPAATAPSTAGPPVGSSPIPSPLPSPSIRGQASSDHDPVLSMRASNPDKFSKLESRIRNSAGSGSSNPSSSSTSSRSARAGLKPRVDLATLSPFDKMSSQRFFARFIVTADSFALNQYLVSILISGISLLQRDLETKNNNKMRNSAAPSDDSARALFSLRLSSFAQFLGLALFYPFWSKETTLSSMRYELPGCPLDLSSILKQAQKSHCLSLTALWMSDFLSLMAFLPPDRLGQAMGTPSLGYAHPTVQLVHLCRAWRRVQTKRMLTALETAALVHTEATLAHVFRKSAHLLETLVAEQTAADWGTLLDEHLLPESPESAEPLPSLVGLVLANASVSTSLAPSSSNVLFQRALVATLLSWQSSLDRVVSEFNAFSDSRGLQPGSSPSATPEKRPVKGAGISRKITPIVESSSVMFSGAVPTPLELAEAASSQELEDELADPPLSSRAAGAPSSTSAAATKLFLSMEPSAASFSMPALRGMSPSTGSSESAVAQSELLDWFLVSQKELWPTIEMVVTKTAQNAVSDSLEAAKAFVFHEEGLAIELWMQENLPRTPAPRELSLDDQDAQDAQSCLTDDYKARLSQKTFETTEHVRRRLLDRSVAICAKQIQSSVTTTLELLLPSSIAAETRSAAIVFASKRAVSLSSQEIAKRIDLSLSKEIAALLESCRKSAAAQRASERNRHDHDAACFALVSFAQVFPAGAVSATEFPLLLSSLKQLGSEAEHSLHSQSPGSLSVWREVGERVSALCNAFVVRNEDHPLTVALRDSKGGCQRVRGFLQAASTEIAALMALWCKVFSAAPRTDSDVAPSPVLTLADVVRVDGPVDGVDVGDVGLTSLAALCEFGQVFALLFQNSEESLSLLANALCHALVRLDDPDSPECASGLTLLLLALGLASGRASPFASFENAATEFLLHSSSNQPSAAETARTLTLASCLLAFHHRSRLTLVLQQRGQYHRLQWCSLAGQLLARGATRPGASAPDSGRLQQMARDLFQLDTGLHLQ